MKVRKLPPALQEKAIRELREDPKRLEEDIQYLKTWLSKQPHIKARTDDQWLLGFLRGSKFSLEKAKEKIDMFYTMKTIVPELLKNRDPLDPKLQEILDLGLFLPLPQTNAEDEIVVLYRTSVVDPSKTDVLNISKIQTMITDVLLLESDNLTIAGAHCVMDSKGATMAHFAGITPSLMKKLMKIFQDSYPARIKGVVYINIPSFFQLVLDLVKQFMNEKLKKRIHIFSDGNINLESIPVSILPKEYGGNAGSLEELTAHWKKKVESYRDWFLEEENYGTNEQKRPGKPKTTENVFGAEGSFRKLEVD